MRTAALIFLALTSCFALSNGSVAMTTGTPVKVTATSTKCVGYVLQAATGNAAKVYVGGSAVTSSTGISLSAGDSLSWLPAGNSSLYDLSTVYALGTTGDSVTYNCQ